MTGAGIMDAKRALQDTGGDVDAAKRLLREKGMASADKRAGRVDHRGQGRLPDPRARPAARSSASAARPSRSRTTTSSWPSRRRCSRHRRARRRRRDRARGRAQGASRRSSARTSRSSRAAPASSGSTPARSRATRIRRRTSSACSCSSAAARPRLARKVAMHIAASAPQYIAREDVPEELVSTERDIYLSSDEVQSKPEQAREKIVEG